MPPLAALAIPPLGTLVLLLLGRKGVATGPKPVIEPPDVAPTPTGPVGSQPPTGDLALPLVPLEGQLPDNRLGTARILAPETGAAFLRNTAGQKIARVPNGAFVAFMEIGPPIPRLPAPAPAVALGWQKVRTSDGRDGFISTELLQVLPDVPGGLPGPGMAGLGGWPFTTGLPPQVTRRPASLRQPPLMGYAPQVVRRSAPLHPTAFARGPAFGPYGVWRSR